MVHNLCYMDTWERWRIAYLIRIRIGYAKDTYWEVFVIKIITINVGMWADTYPSDFAIWPSPTTTLSTPSQPCCCPTVPFPTWSWRPHGHTHRAAGLRTVPTRLHERRCPLKDVLVLLPTGEEPFTEDAMQLQRACKVALRLCYTPTPAAAIQQQAGDLQWAIPFGSSNLAQRTREGDASCLACLHLCLFPDGDERSKIAIAR